MKIALNERKKFFCHTHTYINNKHTHTHTQVHVLDWNDIRRIHHILQPPAVFYELITGGGATSRIYYCFYRFVCVCVCSVIIIDLA